MNGKHTLLLFSFLFLLNFTVKSQIFTLKLFYAINEITAQKNFRRVDSLYKTLGDKKFNVKIHGYADFLYSEQYNISLSQKRADAIKNHIGSKTPPPSLSILECKGFGEKDSRDNNSKEGEAYQRRVDVIVELISNEKTVDTRPVIAPDSFPPKKLEDLVQGESMALEGLSFIPGRHAMMKQSVPILEKLLATMQANPKLKIEIQGHVCCTPGDSDAFDEDTRTKKLSENRAKAVFNYLVKNGIDAKRLRYKGFAHSRLRVPETSPENDQLNRRVEILILEN